MSTDDSDDRQYPQALNDSQAPAAEALEQERDELLQRLENWLEVPMLILAFVWLALLVGELVWGENLSFEVIGTLIWIVFIFNFGVELLLAPRKRAYLKRNWLTVISLLVPALRIFRVFRVVRLLRVARVGRGLRLFRVVSSLNRGMRALGASLHRRGFGYVLALTVLVAFAGAAGMFAFENDVPDGLDTYGEALWWTGMIMTTMGSQYWPVTFEGRVLCVFLSLYAFGVFGYVTATLATFFVGRDAESEEAEVAGARELAALRRELSALREDVQGLAPRPPQDDH
ncbi:ion transporter [Halomonas sp. TRM85114]|uniref:ion transporter n=1 Tax=Halomonas jincaotanensis TaxID=2810616 RepID=UPI001BD36F64|nr:ion transporter [Halomonas jincaotanensis]MBS9403254.1 ion transporter [Halomonas jincaotanensis]